MNSIYLHEHFKDEDVAKYVSNKALVNKSKLFDVNFDSQTLTTKIENNRIGVDWLVKDQCEEQCFVCVSPKLNDSKQEIDYLKMLFSCLQHSDIATQTTELKGLYEIKFDHPFIQIPQQRDDLLTPFLLVQFIQTLQHIVRKGLKRSYYRVQENLNARIKGKVLAAQNIKQNVHQVSRIACEYDVFGTNSPENRILKKTLRFAQKYLASYPAYANILQLVSPVIHFCDPVFAAVDDQIDIMRLKTFKYNVLYREYKQAMQLAKLIWKRFGYHVKDAEAQQTPTQNIKTPPFWIDMAKLFELYVLGKLKNRYQNGITYQEQGNYGKPDFLLKSEKMIIDAKYKRLYHKELHELSEWKKESFIKDIRQLSAYARDAKIRKFLGYHDNSVIDCLIIYPDISQSKSEELSANLTETRINEFHQFYKMPLRLPVI